ncbi:MAG: hypothetical protein WBI53_01715 [Paludibacter sp.]
MKHLIVFLVMTVVLLSCNDDKNTNNKIAISVCGETSPTWLINEINSIVQPVEPNYRPVSVYSIILNNETYVLVTDMVNNAVAYRLRFFMCSGEPVQFETEKYNALLIRYNENREDFTLLWSNSKI